MSAPTMPSTSTSTSFSADELRDIAAAARAWLDSGAPFGLPAEAALSLSPLAEGYAEGVVAERLRGRELRELARQLARSLSNVVGHMRGLLAAHDATHFQDARRDLVTAESVHDEARKAGLLEGGEK